MFGSLLSAGLGLLGSKIAGDDAADNAASSNAQQREWELEDRANYFTGIKSAAKAAGLNFQTALGASGGYSSSSRGFAVGNPSQANIATAAKTAFDVYSEQKQSQATAKEQHENNLALIEAEKAGTRSPASISETPVVKPVDRGFPVGVPGEKQPSLAIPPTAVMLDDAGQEMIGDLTMLGGRVSPNKNTSDANYAEDRYGDVAGSIYGIGVLAADTYKNVSERFKEGHQKQMKKQERMLTRKSLKKVKPLRDNYGLPGSRTGF